MGFFQIALIIVVFGVTNGWYCQRQQLGNSCFNQSTGIIYVNRPKPGLIFPPDSVRHVENGHLFHTVYFVTKCKIIWGSECLFRFIPNVRNYIWEPSCGKHCNYPPPVPFNVTFTGPFKCPGIPNCPAWPWENKAHKIITEIDYDP